MDAAVSQRDILSCFDFMYKCSTMWGRVCVFHPFETEHVILKGTSFVFSGPNNCGVMHLGLPATVYIDWAIEL